MSDLTEIDLAHAAMEAAPEDGAARLRFYERLADSELFLLLEEEAVGDAIRPATFEVEDQTVVLAFDRIERLAGFAGDVSPYAGLSGRGLAAMLAGQRIGIAFNLEVAPSAMLLPAEAVDWLAATLGEGPQELEAKLSAVTPPGQLPEVLLTALDRKLATARGLARSAYLAGVEYEGGGTGHVLAFIGAVEGAEGALSSAVKEALTFSGIEAGALDVMFLRASDSVAASFARVGLRFDLPEPEAPRAAPGSNPGMDPDMPPKLR